VWTKPYFKVKIFRLKCTQFDLQRSPDPLAGFKGPTSKDSVGAIRGGKRGMEGERGRDASKY